MEWLKNIFRTKKDKDQQARQERVSNIVHKRKNNFTKEMVRIQIQAKRVHSNTRKAHQESIKLLEVVNDVTASIAIVTGGLKK